MLNFWLKRGWLSYALLPLSFIYGLVSKLNIIKRAKDSYKSTSFVISIGNINVGGSGKTPVTIAMANYLASQGKKVAVVGHAYKAQIKASEVVDNSYSVDTIGDEAKQMLQMLGSSVMLIVGENRLNSVKLAEEKNADIILLDDGYTATYIHRHLNIVVVDGKVQLGNRFVMPAGPLREPISGLKRSDCMVVLNRQRNLDFEYNKDVFHLKSKINFNKALTTKPLFAFCGLAIPSKFYNSLNKEGLCLQEVKSFADHHKYTYQEIESMIGKAKNNNLQLVTTLKDYVKIDKKQSNDIEVIMLELELTKGFKQFLDKQIKEKHNA